MCFHGPRERNNDLNPRAGTRRGLNLELSAKQLRALLNPQDSQTRGVARLHAKAQTLVAHDDIQRVAFSLQLYLILACLRVLGDIR